MMENIVVVGQDLKVILDVGEDITTATLKMIYRKPNESTENEVDATLYETTMMYYDVADTVLDTVGRWLFRAKWIAADGKIYFGKVVPVFVQTRWFPF